MNKLELINSLKESQSKSIRENRGLILELSSQEVNIAKRKKELEAKQIEQTGKKIEYQAPIPTTVNQGRGPSPEVKVARDVITDIVDVNPGMTRSDVEKTLESGMGGRTVSAKLAANKLDELGDYYAGEVKAGRMTGSQAAKQIQSASNQYKAREDEKFTQDMLKQGEEAAWTAADLAATGAMFATGVGVPAAAARAAATGSRLARAGKAVQSAAKSTGKALTSGPWAGVGIDVAATGAAKANEKLTDDPELKQRYSDIASERGTRAVFGGAFLAGIPAVLKGTQLAGKAVAPITPKVVKEPVKKAAEITGKTVTKLLSGNEAGQVAGGVIGNQIGGMMGGLGGSIVGGHIGTGAVKLFPALGKTVVPKRTGQILRNIGITKTK
jgi:hypothetical protein